MATPGLLIGDIGGTNARFALAERSVPGYSNEQTFRCADFPSASLAINAYLETVTAPGPVTICLAVAGPVVDGAVRLTNNSWSIDSCKLSNEFNGASVKLLNDFEAIAYSIPFLKPRDCVAVGSPLPGDLEKQHYTVGIVGPGTGLGAAGLCRRGDQLTVIVGEAGHQGFAPETDLQIEILGQLRQHFERVFAERLLSGPGLENIYRALGNICGEKNPQLSAAEIFAQAAASGDSTAAEAVQMFFEILGQVAGDYALALGASDGIYIGGGIVKRYPQLFANSRFRTGFERKERRRSWVEKIPTQVILHAQPGLVGASFCAQEMRRKQ